MRRILTSEVLSKDPNGVSKWMHTPDTKGDRGIGILERWSNGVLERPTPEVISLPKLPRNPEHNLRIFIAPRENRVMGLLHHI
jgi:hypothetical protein